MKITYSPYQLILVLFLLISGCIESYPPPIVDDEINFLVVDGSVNSTDGTAEVKISRAVALASTETSPPELNAVVSVEDSDGNTYPLTDEGGGLYQQSNLPIDITKEYRLYVKTSNQSEYRSDYIAIKKTPEIDSVTWAPSRNNDGIDILINTHDNTKNTIYYQWAFEETYEYEAVYFSYIKVVNGEIVSIPTEEETFRCWRTLPSQKILIGSSERLNQDVIYNFPVTFIPKGSQKLTVKYSVLVKQRALSRQAYDYWQNLQQTTENLGGLFDPQPGKVTSNIYNINNSNDPILGYFFVGETKEKRLFIKSDELPDDLRSYKSMGSCKMDTVLIADLPSYNPSGKALVGTIYMGPFVIGYNYSTAYCADCRYQHGVTTKPTFWE